MGGGKEEGRREDDGQFTRFRLVSVPGLVCFCFGWMDGLLEALVWFVWLVWSGLVWSGLVWMAVLSSVGEVTTRSVLSVCSFVSCCMLYTVYSTRSVLSLRF